MKQLAHAAPAPIACQRGSPGSLRIETDALSPITVAGYRIRAAESAPDRSHSLGVSAARLQVSRLRLGPLRSLSMRRSWGPSALERGDPFGGPALARTRVHRGCAPPGVMRQEYADGHGTAASRTDLAMRRAWHFSCTYV